MIAKLFVTGVFFFLGFMVSAQNLKVIQGDRVPRFSCYASGKVEKSFISPPAVLKSIDPLCDIVVTYIDFPEDAESAFEYAVEQWEKLIESDRPIRIEVTWDDEMASSTLGSCGPEAFYADFTDSPFRGVYYPVAVAEKIAGEELNGSSRFDIIASFNSTIDWYLGTDGATPYSQYDFVTVVMHEIAHGLGYTGFFDSNGDIGSYGFYEFGDASTFDLLVVNNYENQLVDTSYYNNLSSELGAALESGDLYANSPIAKAANGGVKPRLYVPTSFDAGSSIYHLNEASYTTGNLNSLMTPMLGKGEAIHNPGELSLGILEDMGWSNLFIRFEPLKDKYEIGPLTFNVMVESDYKIDSSALYVIYSIDGFQLHSDTLLLSASNKENTISATLIPDAEVDSISYYLQVKDTMNRVRTLPCYAPREYYVIKFGPDSEKPVITHTPIPYFLMTDEPLLVEAQADDNFGIDTVFVRYALNDGQTMFFGLSKKQGTTYSGYFNFNMEELKDGDIVSYNIVAKDSSLAANTTVFPEDEAMVFKVEEIFDPVSSYVNDFNNSTADFLTYDFDVYTASNFTNGALHSPHPYASPNVDNEEFNFFTFLKYPIIIKEEGSMTFDEVVLVEPGETESAYGDAEYWDYAIIEGSKDYGETWMAMTDGYDSGDKEEWLQSYNLGIVGQDSETDGSSDLFFNREISLPENGNFQAGDTVLIRFRLYSDAYANGWGWAIDNLRIQQPLAATITNLSVENIRVYPNPFENSVTVAVSSSGNLDELTIEVFNVVGTKVYSTTVQDVRGLLNTEINLARLGGGLFLVRVSENGKQVLSKKLIKN